MKITTKGALCLTSLWLALSSSMKDPSNPPVANTGAPGETTCQQSGCHSGGTYTGTVSISGIPDTVVANTSYTITLTNKSDAVRAGFQMVCLDASNAQCGSFTVGTGTSIGTSGSKQYIRQSQYKTLSSGSTSWTFTWKSPATITTPITFYFVSLAANGNGSTSGDNVLKSSKAVIMQTTTASDEVENGISIKLYPNPTTDVMTIEMKDVTNARLMLTDMSGRLVLTQNLIEKFNRVNISTLAKGIYNAQVKAGEKSISKKIVIE